MGSHFHQGGVIYALGRNDWGSHFPGGVIRDFDTGPDHRTTINFCARSQKCACALDCKDLEHSPGLWPKRYQGNTVTIQRNDQTCVLAASHAAYASLLPYVNEHIQAQEMTKEDIEKTLPGPCTCFPPHPPDGGSFLILSTL